MSEDPLAEMNSEIEVDDGAEGEEEEEDIGCMGEYGLSPLCEECRYAKSCKRLAEAERTIAHRYKGKYQGKGKEQGRDRF